METIKPNLNAEDNDDHEAALMGPASWTNYQAYLRGSPRTGAEEYGLYSDTHFTGQLLSGIGPYRFYNTMPPMNDADNFAESIVVRVDLHLGAGRSPDLDETYVRHWHGGSLDDELAALLSLATGRRVRSGGLVRVFVQGSDPAGHPIRWHYRAPNPPRHGRRRLLVYSTQETGLASAGPLIARVANLEAEAAIALIRSARSYSDALWLGDSEPATAWLALVSALEAAAENWSKETVDPVEALASAKPKIKKLLEARSPDLLSEIAYELQGITGATTKFLKFTLAHLPVPPPVRPQTEAQVKWSKTQLSKGLRVIYGHRSAALHAGIPVPGPMCLPPDEIAEGEYAERPLGPIAIGDSVWRDADLPMFLHTFEYLVRGALINWWEELSSTNRNRQ